MTTVKKKVISFSLSEESWGNVTSTARALGIGNSALIERLIQETKFPEEKIEQILKLQDEVRKEMRMDEGEI